MVGHRVNDSSRLVLDEVGDWFDFKVRVHKIDGRESRVVSNNPKKFVLHDLERLLYG